MINSGRGGGRKEGDGRSSELIGIVRGTRRVKNAPEPSRAKTETAHLTVSSLRVEDIRRLFISSSLLRARFPLPTASAFICKVG